MRKVRELGDSEVARGDLAPLIDQSMPRGTGYRLKRTTSFNRESAGSGKNNGRLLEHAALEAVRLSCGCEGVHFRWFEGEGIDGCFCKRNLDFHRIAISVIALCFLAITLMQGSVMLIVKHTDFLTIPSDEVSKVPDTSHIFLGVDGTSACERAVRNAMENFTERLAVRARLPEVGTFERYSRRPPRLALICPNLEEVPDTLYLSTIAGGLQWLGYGLEPYDTAYNPISVAQYTEPFNPLYTRQDGHLRPVWEDIGVPVHFVQEDWQHITVDWSIFEGVVAFSLDAKKIVERKSFCVHTSLVQEPFTDIPLVWIIHENIVLDQDTAWNASAELQTIFRSWLQTFNRSSVLVFTNYFLPLIYNDFYNERFYVIPGSPWDVWEAKQYMIIHTREDARAKAGLSSDDYVIVVVGSPCTNKEIWREHAIVMKAVANLTSSFTQHDGKLGSIKLFILGHGNSTSGYKDTLQMMAQHVGLRDEVVKHVGVDEDVCELLWLADILVYATIWEELSFPPILLQAMSFERPVIVPDLGALSQQIVDRHSGFVFPAGDYQALGQVLSIAVWNQTLAHNVALEGSFLARDFLAREAVVEYGYLLETLLDIPEEAHLPRPTIEMQEVIPQAWRWDILGEPVTIVDNSKVKDLLYLKSATDLRVISNDSGSQDRGTSIDDSDWLNEKDWSQERQSWGTETWEELENDLMKDRLDRARTSFEEVNKMAKKTETRVTQDKDLEIDDLEIERVAQPLCIYEPYHGSGPWSFLHRDHLLYQGLSLSAQGRRRYLDDVDGAKHLRLLNNSYYRDVLCDISGFFAVAKHIDRVHRNSWIGFQPWRAASRKVALTLQGEAALLAAVSEENDGDALYFWAPLNSRDSQLVADFWSSCDLANAGNCRTVFLNTFKEMYGLPSSWMQLPPMPTGGGAWAGMHCWAMPTTSFLEFVMFARMFVNAMDALQYEDHHERGRCCFKNSGFEVKHCYCNFLEGLVNVWAYHSARRMIYLDPESGLMQEEHQLEQRKGRMWVKWFRQSLLKSMDEDLAEEADDEQPNRRWLWPETGEVFWQGTKERERRETFEAKVEKKRRQLERQARQSKYKQRAIGRYNKPKVAKRKIL